MKKYLLFALAVACATSVSSQEVPAFPGAEGYGRYTTGGRGGSVIHVTNLNDSGYGSLRDAVNGSAKKTIVFDVSGEIALESDLYIGANTTIAGQTAPGQGITIRYYTVRPKGNNIIVRFVRIRRGQERDVNDGADATWARQYNNIIFDHCSFSWSIDEVASYYDNRNFTMQWCNIAEALCNAGHGKGAHGYGGIWGGKGASFHHNMIAHVNNRAPRFNGARYAWDGYDKTAYPNTVQAERVDFRNCLVYNWGNGNGCYGGPGGGYINMINNYFKAGPSTVNKTRVTQVSVLSKPGSGESTKLKDLTSRYYINGNYVTAAKSPANYDWSGVIYDSGVIQIGSDRYCIDANSQYPDDEVTVANGTRYVPIKMNEPFEAAAVTTHSAETAYDKVLAYGGASLFSDIVDIRHIDEARNGTATYKGSVTGLGGQLDIVADQGEYTIASESRPADYDTDHDGIPDSWEAANGLDPRNVNDGKAYTLDPKGWYTNLEVYINSLVEDIMKQGNADADTSVDEYYPVCAGFSNISSDRTVVTIEYYNLQGVRLSEPQQGYTIRRIIYADGRSVSDKIYK